MRERDRLERELRDSESRYRFLVENSPDIVFSIDAEGRFTFMADTIERVAGWRPEQVVGQHFSMVVDVDSYQTAATAWQALASQPTVEQVAHINMISPDGRPIPVEVSSIGMVDADGRFAGIHGSTRDISERARLERELRRQAGELAAGEERAHLARELHDSVTQALFSMTLVTARRRAAARPRPGGRQGAARPAARAAARSAGRDAGADLRAPAGQPRAGRPDPGAADAHGRRSRDGSGCRSSSRARSRSGSRWPSRRSSTGSPRRRSTTSSSMPPPVRSGSRSTGPTHGVRLRIEDDGKGFDPRTRARRPSRPGRDARPRRQDRRPVHVPERAGPGDHDRGRRARTRSIAAAGPVVGTAGRRHDPRRVADIRRADHRHSSSFAAASSRRDHRADGHPAPGPPSRPGSSSWIPTTWFARA